VPVGRYSEGALKKAKLWDAVQPKAISTQNVRQSLDYVARGEVDAGFVRHRRGHHEGQGERGAGSAAGNAHHLSDRRDRGQRQPAEAKRFVSYVQSPPAQAMLAKYGFGSPNATAPAWILPGPRWPCR
jgi:molybdate transport system substrate-binding protein